MSPVLQYDAVVVGGNFAGLSAAMQLGRARRRVLVVDMGEPRNRFAEASHGFMGQDGKPPRAIQREAARQVAAYPTVEMLQDQVVSASGELNGFELGLWSGRQVRARRVVLATGVRDILPNLPGLAERWGVSVLHCPYCHGYEVRDRPIGVLASTPMSAHQAMLLPDWGVTTLFTNGVHEPDPEQAALLAARGVTIERTPVVELVGQGTALEGLRLADGRVAAVEALFAAPRVEMASPLAAQLGCVFEDGMMGPFIVTDAQKLTSVPGVYAAGDAARPMHNATFASADGVMAGVGAHQSLARDVLAA
ncbi:NAD(P)/FAD-dependent oxidoreductase [Caulobacter mirabilis]|uniref:Thioredoxin reductase n=1 Tax=Caulobacter mirabilis TaxID=69666 RepID=A0A2D2AU19_9CAUL|nr:NAD(P)/FAD-dependent oxidoreductase [Caulobacter mirabilis]ATQ41473.1 thioredoxin reductase [Caulobacter mirabilis]